MLPVKANSALLGKHSLHAGHLPEPRELLYIRLLTTRFMLSAGSRGTALRQVASGCNFVNDSVANGWIHKMPLCA